MLGMRGRHQYAKQRFNQIIAPCVASTAVGTEKKEDQGRIQIVSIKRAADGKRQGNKEIVDKKRGKYRAKNESLRNTSTDSKGTTFVILINQVSAPIKHKRLNPTIKTKKEAGRNTFVEKYGVPDRIESF